MAPSRLSVSYLIETPIGETTIVDTVYPNCVVKIEDRELPVNLLQLDFKDLDVVLWHGLVVGPSCHY